MGTYPSGCATLGRNNVADSQIYQCQCAGHQGGRSFSAAPEKWFTDRNLNTPKKCPECRKWIRAQRDEYIHCANCSIYRPLPARYKIFHHLRLGKFERPTLCYRCESGKPVIRTTKGLRPRERHKERKADEGLGELPIGNDPQPLPIPVTFGDYAHYTWENGRKVPRYVHILRHVPGSKYTLTNPVVAQYAGRRVKSPSAFAPSDGDFEKYMTTIHHHLNNFDPQNVRQYTEGKRIVHVTFLSQAHAEVTILERTPGASGFRMVTSYDNVTIQEIHDNLSSRWK